MNSPLFNIGRYTRLALLLLMLAAQGIAVAHDIGDSHGLQTHPCSTCILGHGLGGAVNVHPDVPQVQVAQAPLLIHSIADVLASRSHYYFTRAPPRSLCNTPKLY
jgi:hypothetical protein